MAIYATNESKTFEPVPAGNHIARCISMIDIGQVVERFNNEDKIIHKVRIGWELPEEKKVFKEGEPEKPYTVSKEFSLSMHEKANLRKFLESWRGKGFSEEETKQFDITKLLGIPCMLSVIHKTSKQGRTYSDISAISTLPKGTKCPAQINESFEFNFLPWDQDKFDSLPDWLKDKIKTSKEYKWVMQPENEDTQNDDDFVPPEDNQDLPF